MYRSAGHIVTVGEGYRDNVLTKVKPTKPVSVVTNGVDLDLFQPREGSDEFRKKYDLEDRFVCSYVGTIGMAHGLEVVVRAAKIIRQQNRQDIVFCMVGDGASRARVEQLASEEEVSDLIRFTGRLEKSRMPEVLASSDCLLIHLKKADLFETVIPSKIFESMAMQRPLIMGVGGLSAEIVRRSEAGVFMESENEQQLAEAVILLHEDKEGYRRFCERGRDFVAANYSRDTHAASMLSLLESVALGD